MHSELVKCIMAILVKAENLHNDATVTATCPVKVIRLKKAMNKQVSIFIKQHEAFTRSLLRFIVADDVNSP